MERGPVAAIMASAVMLAALAGCDRREQAPGQDSVAAVGPDGAAVAALPNGALEAVRALKTDPSAPFRPLNLQVIDALSARMPELASVRGELADRERRALTALFRQYPGVEVQVAYAEPARPNRVGWARMVEGLLPSAHAQSSMANVQGLRAIVAPGSATNLVALLGGVPDDARGARNGAVRREEIPGKSGPDASLEVTAKDGATTITLETRVDAPLFLLEAGSKLALSTQSLCPDASGQATLTMRLDQGGKAGASGRLSFDRGREATVRIQVDDRAEVASAEIDTRYSERFSDGDRQVYMEAGTRWALGAGGESASAVMKSHRLLRQSSQAQDGDGRRLMDGLQESYQLGLAAKDAAERRWKSGACIGIEATSPGQVARKQVSKIAVQVVHKFEGEDVAAQVDAALQGGASVNPGRIEKSPGTISHEAVDKAPATMRIELTALSRRGRAQRTLDIYTGGRRFQIEGGADEFRGTGHVCDLTQPFRVSGSGVTVSFTPTSDRAGSYSYEGSMSGFGVQGKGRYSVDYNGDLPTQIRAYGPGSVSTPNGTVAGEGDEHYTLTPAPEGNCD